MATRTFTAAPTNASDAQFRAWGSQMSAALAAIGLVKAPDTGQIDWATVTRPTAINTQQGFEVWRFDDALQATAPVYLRIGYGTGGAANLPCFWVTVGKGSNGAGGITTVLTPETQVGASTTASATPFPWYFAGDGSMLLMVMPPSWSSAGGVAVIERSRASDGAPAPTAILTAYQPTGVGGVVVRTANYASGAMHSGIPGWPVGMPINMEADLSLATGGTAPLFPAAVHDGAGNWWQPRGVLVGMLADLGRESAVNVPGFGTYLATGKRFWGGQYATAAIWWQ